METRAHFALIGTFTLAVLVAAFAFVFWFSGSGKQANRKTYRIVFTSSVSGMSRGSWVLFNGLRVGDVTSIDLGDDPSQVVALIDVDRRTPVKADTRARLEYQGLTGVASVALSGGSADAAALEAGKDGKPPTLFAERSEFQNIVETLQTLSGKVDSLLERTDKLIADNSESISHIIHNTEKFSDAVADNADGIRDFLASLRDAAQSIKPFIDTLNKNRDNVDAIVTSARDLTAKLNKSADKVDSLLASAQGLINQPGSKGMFENVSEAAVSIRDLAKNLDARTKELSAGINRFTGPGLRQYEALAADSRRTLDEISRTVRSFEKNPQQLIFGGKPQIPEYSGK
jgi:phospholipid/cholesterol/gamma-HCH transport system substrate-binding protein